MQEYEHHYDEDNAPGWKANIIHVAKYTKAGWWRSYSVQSYALQQEQKYPRGPCLSLPSEKFILRRSIQ